MSLTTPSPHRDPEPLGEPDEVALARFIAEAGGILGESLDVEATVRRVARLAVPRIADWCAVELLDPDGRLEELALVHDDPAKVELVRTLRRDYPGDPDRPAASAAVAASGTAAMVPDVTPEMLAETAVDERHRRLLADLDLRSYMCVPLRAGGEVVGALTLATDGSGRRFGATDLAAAEDLAGRAATAIQNAHAFRAADRFRRILDTIAEAVFVIEPTDGRIREVNREATALLGLAAPDILGRRIWEFTADIDVLTARTIVRPLLDGVLEARTISTAVVDPARPDRPGRPVEVLVQRIDLPGDEIGLVAIARDVRDRVEAQARLERLAEAEHARAAELNAVIRAMGDGVVVCARDGRISLTNPAAQDLFPGVLQRSYEDILAQLHDPDGLAPRLGGHEGPVVLPTAPAGSDRWIEVTTYPVRADPADRGPADETIVVLRDVTAARQREAIRETFIGVLSHELRTPVTTIYGGAKLLARRDSTLDESTRRAVFADIVAEAERLQRLVEDVVALNRFGEAGGDLGQEPVLLQRLVPSVVASEETRWPSVAFLTRVPPGLPTVVADPTYVEQVVRNLVSNAAKYGGPGSSVEIVLERGGDEVAVRILDDGPGIDPEEADRLFELFYRSPATATGTSGAGIGLFVCARLVRAMGGRIWALARPTGGSEFGFSLQMMADD